MPTPRLGGVAIAVTTTVASLLAWGTSSSDVRALVVICGTVALVGLRDDLRPMSASLRIALHVAASARRRIDRQESVAALCI